MNLKKENVQDGEAAFAFLRQWFNESKEKYDEDFDQAARQLEYAFDFMESAFAGGQELVVFITELNTSSPAVSFLQEYSCREILPLQQGTFVPGKYQRHSGADPAAGIRRPNAKKKSLEAYFYHSVCSGGSGGNLYVSAAV